MKTNDLVRRCSVYSFGMGILAFGLTLTAKTGLGASSLTAVPYVLSIYMDQSFADVTLAMYFVYIFVQLFLDHEKKAVILTMLQLPVSVAFTRVMHLSGTYIRIEQAPLLVRILFLLFAVVLTGIGVAMALQADLVPTPAEGMVHTIAEKTKKPLGMVKNAVDIGHVCMAVLLSLLFLHKLAGVGIGSLISMVGVGRVVACYDRMIGGKKKDV